MAVDVAALGAEARSKAREELATTLKAFNTALRAAHRAGLKVETEEHDAVSALMGASAPQFRLFIRSEVK
ncbi:hypothetical protein [Thioclava sp. GXIMD4215]|uniref:hypothetical protein n=1 Tax=Thioclava sp. GXIMD4215 TaxID=3131928 RepID=UPI00324E1A89